MKWRNLLKDEGALLTKSQVRITWDGLVMFKEKWLVPSNKKGVDSSFGGKKTGKTLIEVNKTKKKKHVN